MAKNLEQIDMSALIKQRNEFNDVAKSISKGLASTGSAVSDMAVKACVKLGKPNEIEGVVDFWQEVDKRIGEHAGELIVGMAMIRQPKIRPDFASPGVFVGVVDYGATGIEVKKGLPLLPINDGRHHIPLGFDDFIPDPIDWPELKAKHIVLAPAYKKDEADIKGLIEGESLKNVHDTVELAIGDKATQRWVKNSPYSRQMSRYVDYHSS